MSATFVKNARNVQFYPVYKMVDTCAAEFEANSIIFTLVILAKMSKFQVEKEKLLLSAAVQFELARELNLIIALSMAYLL